MNSLTKMKPLQGYYSQNYHLGDEVKIQKGMGGVLNRHVLWLRNPHSGINHAGIQFLKMLECTLLAISIIGIPFLKKGYLYSKKIDSYKQFNNQKFNPPPFETVEIKSEKAGFNHINYYAINDNALWFKPKNQTNAKWESFYFDGMVNGTVPVELSVDGANLCVKDDEGYIHYKKVLKEQRFEEEGEQIYRYTDKTIKDNWKESWFSLPVVSFVVNCIKQIIFVSKRLKLDENIKSWGISQRGVYNWYYSDQAGTNHAVSIGVTTLFGLFKGSNDIYFADPWLPFGFKNFLPMSGFGLSHKIPGPEKEGFKSEFIDASASTIALTGYIETEDGDRKIAIYTRLGDFDADGKNPFLKYTDESEKTVENEVRLRKPAPWQQQPDFPSESVIFGTKVTIFQTGEGNLARELRIEGKNDKDQKGYFWKNINDLAWHFTMTDECLEALSVSDVDLLPYDKKQEYLEIPSLIEFIPESSC
jgi:hypothetical protein